jgi:4-amino-4-deoxy-L-arabinose transferase-like glycosyltransferase
MSRTRLSLLVIFVIALGARAAYVASDLHPDYRPWLYGGMAHDIVHDGHWFQINLSAVDFGFTLHSTGPMIEPPDDPQLRYADAHPRWEPEIGEPVGEPVVLAALWEITGSERFLPDQILKALLDALTVLLVYRIAMRLFERPRAALLAAFLYAIYPPLAWQVSSPTPDSWAVDFTIAIVAIYLEAIHSNHRWRWLILCGVLAGIGSYFRPAVLLLPAALALATVMMTGWRRALRMGLCTTAIAAVLVIPWTIRNYDDFHAFVLLRSGVGQTLWEGLGEVHNDFGALLNDEATYHQVRRTHPDIRYVSPEFDSLLLHRAVRAIEHHPFFYLELLARRTVLATVWARGILWMHRGTVSPFADGHGLVSYIVNRPFDLLQMSLSPMTFILAIICLGFTWRRWRREHMVLIMTALFVIVPYIPIYVEFRYILPSVFAYLIWIGLGADLLLERVTQTQRWSRFRANRLLPAGSPGHVEPLACKALDALGAQRLANLLAGCPIGHPRSNGETGLQ